MLRFKKSVNSILTRLQFAPVKQCSARVYDRPCTNLTQRSDGLCSDHSRLLKLTTKTYHFVDLKEKYKKYGVHEGTLAKVENRMRERFFNVFPSISLNYGHWLWQRHLEDISVKPDGNVYFLVNSTSEDFDLVMDQYHLDTTDFSFKNTEETLKFYGPVTKNRRYSMYNFLFSNIPCMYHQHLCESLKDVQIK